MEGCLCCQILRSPQSILDGPLYFGPFRLIRWVWTMGVIGLTVITTNVRYFEQNRVMVSLTSLLVQVSLFTQTADNTPKTSYLKLIDVWFMCVIVLDFLIISVIVFIENLRQQQRQKQQQQQLQKHQRQKHQQQQCTPLIKIREAMEHHPCLDIRMLQNVRNPKSNTTDSANNKLFSSSDIIRPIARGYVRHDTYYHLNYLSKIGFPIIYGIFLIIYTFAAVA